MKHLSWIITLPLLVLFIVFAVANRTPTQLNLWPLEYQITLPLFLMVLAALFVGFLCGGLVAWFSGHRTRERARRGRYELDTVNRDLLETQRQLARAKAEIERLRRGSPDSQGETAGSLAVLSGSR